MITTVSVGGGRCRIFFVSGNKNSFLSVLFFFSFAHTFVVEEKAGEKELERKTGGKKTGI